MQFLLFHLVWNCPPHCIWRLWWWGWRLLLVHRRAALCLWVVGIRCHSKKNYVWPKERHNKVHACWVWFVLCFQLIWEDISLRWTVLLPNRRLPLFTDTSLGSLEVNLFISSLRRLDKLFFSFVVSRSDSKCFSHFYLRVCSQFCELGIQSTVWLVLDSWLCMMYTESSKHSLLSGSDYAIVFCYRQAQKADFIHTVSRSCASSLAHSFTLTPSPKGDFYARIWAQWS